MSRKPDHVNRADEARADTVLGGKDVPLVPTINCDSPAETPSQEIIIGNAKKMIAEAMVGKDPSVSSDLSSDSDPEGSGEEKPSEPIKLKRMRALFSGHERFEIVGQIGEGGNGEVYEALDKQHNRLKVAVKKLAKMTPKGLGDFRREFRSLNDLHHPNLVSCSELFMIKDPETGEEIWFYTMELVRGVTFVQYVRQAKSLPAEGDSATMELRADSQDSLEIRTGFSEKRLREAFIQLLQGVLAIQEAGKIHRDLKPANILVTEVNGALRVVVLDFGLARRTAGEDQWDPESIEGTPLYMAPEQAFDPKGVGPEADVYALGVILFETMTERGPFQANSFAELFNKKKEQLPVFPKEIENWLPAELKELCLAMLKANPKERPTLKQILEKLGKPAESPKRNSMAASMSQEVQLVGREKELAMLQTAFNEIQTAVDQNEPRAPITILAEGQSGVGKSVLLRTFARQMRDRISNVLLLESTCHEQEHVPYKAFDGVMDQAAQTWRALEKKDPAMAGSLVPKNIGALRRVFPVLERVNVVATLPKQKLIQIDAHELKQRVFEALKDLFVRFSRQRVIILVIDDLQWKDKDSQDLLSAFLSGSDAPTLLLLASKRNEGGAEALPGELRHMPIGDLSEEAARELAKKTIRGLVNGSGAEVSEEDMRAIVSESRGHPMLLEELVRDVLQDGETVSQNVDLDESLWRRICSLEPEAQDLIHRVAVAGRPMQQGIFEEMGLWGNLPKTLQVLKSAHLIRTTGSRRTDTVAPYHDRVRESVFKRLPAGIRRTVHQDLANQLQIFQKDDFQALAHHWEQAGNKAMAAQNAILAASQFETALAFEQVVRFADIAIRLKPEMSAAEMHQLQQKRAAALANLGRGAEAAEAYLEAAKYTNNPDALIQHAADQYLRCGKIQEGMEIYGRILPKIGIPIYHSAKEAKLPLVLALIKGRIMGQRYKAKKTSQIPMELIQKRDACNQIGKVHSLLDPILGTLYSEWSNDLALRAGEPIGICQAMGTKALYYSVKGSKTRAITDSYRAKCRELAEALKTPETDHWASIVDEISFYLQADVKKSHEAYRNAVRQGAECSGDINYEAISRESWGMWSLYQMGEMKSLKELIPPMITKSTQRGDGYGPTYLRLGILNAIHLADDNPKEAQKAVVEAMQNWKGTQEARVPAYHEAIAEVQILLYAGKAQEAFERATRQWTAMKEAYLTDVQVIRVEYGHLCARAALEAGHLKEARKYAKKIGKEEMPWAAPLSKLIQAALVHAEGDEKAAVQLLRQSIEGSQAANLTIFEMPALWRLGELLGKDGHEETAKALQWAHAQGIKNPQAWFQMLAPFAKTRG